MKYMCLVYIEERKLAAMSDRQLGELVNEALDSDDRLRDSGHYVTSAALENVQAATTVRLQDGKRSVTDGPFAETKEQLGGFILIDVGDLDEAIELAAKIPMARLGGIEIRPVQELARRDLAAPE